MLFDWHISIYDWAIWDSPAEAPQYLQKKNSVCYQTNIYLNIRYFYLGSILQLSFLYSVLIVNSWMCYLPDKYHHCWFNTLIQVYQIVIVFCSLFINFKYWWIAHWRTILRWAILSMSSASFRECFLSLKPEAIIEPINILSALGKSAKNKLTLAPPLGMVVTIMFLEMIFILIFFRKKRKRRTFVL